LGNAGLLQLDITDFRNIKQATLQFSPTLNLITGANAAGKTSLLEAIYSLGRVRSFRTPTSDRLIRYGQPGYRVVGRIGGAAGRLLPIGVQRQQGKYRVRLDGQPVKRLSDLAGRFPVQIFSNDTPNTISGGPGYRRQALDWALFHVEHGYRDAWQRYAAALRQRNAALRQHVPASQVSAWDEELVDAAGTIDSLRRRYLEALAPHVNEEIDALLPDRVFTLRYQPGWPADRTLQDALAGALDKDRAKGHTGCGPHRADFLLQADGRAVQPHFSRGQIKTIAAGFLMGQVRLQHVLGLPPGAFLLDDLASELDADHQARLLAGLAHLGAQVFVTAIVQDPRLERGGGECRRFHVEHGDIQEVV